MREEREGEGEVGLVGVFGERFEREEGVGLRGQARGEEESEDFLKEEEFVEVLQGEAWDLGTEGFREYVQEKGKGRRKKRGQWTGEGVQRGVVGREREGFAWESKKLKKSYVASKNRFKNIKKF